MSPLIYASDLVFEEVSGMRLKRLHSIQPIGCAEIGEIYQAGRKADMIAFRFISEYC
jgi:hypothetical protein